MAASLSAQTGPKYSADYEFTSPHGRLGSAKIYSDGQMVRVDMNMMGRDTILIMDLAKKVRYILMPQQHQYIEKSTDMAAHRGSDMLAYDPGNPCKDESDTTCRKIGTEAVNGAVCDKWQFNGTGNNAGRTVWIEQKSGIPFKTEMSIGGTIELKSIKEGAPDVSLFEIPPDYQKMPMGMEGPAPPGTTKSTHNYTCTSEITKETGQGKKKQKEVSKLIVEFQTDGPLTTFDSKNNTQPSPIFMEYEWRKLGAYKGFTAPGQYLTAESAVYTLDPATLLPSAWSFRFHDIGDKIETVLTSDTEGSGFKEDMALQGGLHLLSAYSGPKCVWSLKP